MNNKDFLKGMIAYKIITDSKHNSSGGSSGGGCGPVIFIALIVIVVTALIGSCVSGNKTSNYSSTSPRYSDSCQVSGCPYRKMNGSYYCIKHTCHEPGCFKKAYEGGYCSLHQPKTTAATRATKPATTKSTTKSTTRSTERKDPYDISSYSDIDDFYEDWYDDFDGFDDAEVYWDDHH